MSTSVACVDGTPRSPGRPSRPDASQEKGGWMGPRIRKKRLTEMTRQLATLLDAGVPVVRALSILHKHAEQRELRRLLAVVRSDVENGASFSEALAAHARVFDKLYVSMVKAGEASGMLDQILARLADYLEKSERLKQQVLGALAYPVAVVTIAMGLLTFIMLFIIPQFEGVFREMGMEALPPMTALLLGIANTLKTFWYLVVLLPVGLWIAYRFCNRTVRGRFAVDLVKLKIPIFGMIVSKSSISRFCRTLGTLIQSGVPLLKALSIVQNTSGNAVVGRAVGDVYQSVKAGNGVAEPMEGSLVFKGLVVSMIQIGDETGDLDKMLIKVADTYEQEVDTVVGSLMTLLEPALIVGMGFGVGFIVISLFMPLIGFMSHLNG